jgi:hypothetical protein
MGHFFRFEIGDRLEDVVVFPLFICWPFHPGIYLMYMNIGAHVVYIKFDLLILDLKLFTYLKKIPPPP